VHSLNTRRSYTCSKKPETFSGTARGKTKGHTRARFSVWACREARPPAGPRFAPSLPHDAGAGEKPQAQTLCLHAASAPDLLAT